MNLNPPAAPRHELAVIKTCNWDARATSYDSGAPRFDFCCAAPAVRAPGDIDVARMCLAEEFAKIAARRGHAKEVAEAIEDIDGIVDEGLTWRLSQAAAGSRVRAIRTRKTQLNMTPRPTGPG